VIEFHPEPFDGGYRAAILQEDGAPLVAFGPTWPTRSEAMIYCFEVEGYVFTLLSSPSLPTLPGNLRSDPARPAPSAQT
jgi:hypothetical protein